MLHVVEFAIEALRENDFEFIKQIATVDYTLALKRDSQIYDKIDLVCQKYFNG